jgi:hypothetical protein
MKTRTYWIPAATLADASTVARAVHRGAAPRMPWHDDEAACQRRADECNAIFGARPIKPFAILIEERTVDDGRILNVWPVEPLGDLAAMLTLVVGGCWLVGWSTLL